MAKATDPIVEKDPVYASRCRGHGWGGGIVFAGNEDGNIVFAGDDSEEESLLGTAVTEDDNEDISANSPG